MRRVRVRLGVWGWEGSRQHTQYPTCYRNQINTSFLKPQGLSSRTSQLMDKEAQRALVLMKGAYAERGRSRCYGFFDVK